jgi:GDPmannose 4,6-dehydratase
MKRALITGISGQDGSYLAELLLGLGYEVHGLARQTSLEQLRSRHLHGASPDLYERCKLHAVSLDNFPGLYRLVSGTQFDECYHLAASSFVGENLADGYQTIQTNISGAHYLLAALSEFQKDCRFYHAGSSEMFGRPQNAPQDESTPFMPRSPYGISKLAAFHLTRNYREAKGMFCCTGILYNHESPRRRPEFVTRKITRAVARISAGLQDRLELGNLAARRDWGHARDHVRAMHAMLAPDKPQDYVVATGCLHSVGEFCEIAFSHAGLDWRAHVTTNPLFYRAEEDVPLQGNPARIRDTLGWNPKTTFDELVREMVDADVAQLRKPD